MFYRSSRLRRTVAAFLLLQTTTGLVWPVATYALTAGPTAPEATSFEPVDTTDMVNLNSGDMSYGVPLLEVPGPEGGYPLALSYHAGIQPDEEASWVGLGWGLNPGAISRNVNGYADDQENAEQSVRDYWEGGKTETTRVGVSVGIAGAASVSVGLSFSQDTYQGFGVGGQLGVAVGKEIGGATLGASAVIGVTGYGQTFGGVGIGVSGQAGQFTGSIGLSTNFQSVSASVGVGYSNGDPKNHIKSTMSAGLLGASISSSGSKPTLLIGGGNSSFHNDKSGKIQTDVQSESMDLPVFYGVSISLGYDYVRYWSDETERASVNGALYYPKQASSVANLDNHDYDTYRLLDPNSSNILDHPDPDYLSGGSFPNCDNYSVVAQGLSGSMRPYSFQEGLYSKNRKAQNGVYTIQDNPSPSWNNKAVSFRFENDFSNQYRQQNAAVTPVQGSAMAYSFDTNPTYGNGDGSVGYDPTQDRLAGSKHIEWFTNQDITNSASPISSANQKGFINTEARGFNREYNTQVGGFMITNESGVTYHFALPAYSYKETVYTENADRATRGLITNTVDRPSKYAYTWFLTAITGPDYVDRNQNGLVDGTDWGYWIAFDYGKWADDFQWRNPSEGLREDIDGGFKSYSTGFKEVYYLNKIRTRTHTALFEKEVRADGKSYAGPGYGPAGDGGPNIPPGTTKDQWDGSTWSSTTMPKASLRLTNIYLVNNADVPSSLESRSNTYDFKNYSSQETRPNGTINDRKYIRDHHYGRNVIDIYDTKAVKNQLVNSAIRIIKLNYDYSLSPATANSYDPDGRNYTTSDNTVLTSRTGKLTLQSVSFLGVKGAGLLPDTKFAYELSSQETSSDNIQIAAGESGDGTSGVGYIMGTQTGKFNDGDIVTFTAQGKQVYCTVLKNNVRPSTPYYKVLFINGIFPQPGSFQASTTKNPPYIKDFHDTWNLFKSDIDLEALKADENIARKTTIVSSKGVDVWSLRRITSALGSTVSVAYDSDDYKAIALKRPEMLAKFGNKSYYEFFDNSNSNFQAYMKTQSGLGVISLADIKTKISSILKVGQEVLVSGIVEDWSCDCNGNSASSCIYRSISNKKLKIQSIQDDDSGNRVNYVYLADPNGEIFKSAPCNVANNSVRSITHLMMGHLQTVPSNENIYGGGLRVQSITLSGSGLTHRTRYSYANASESTGTTSIEPGSIRSLDKTLYDYYKIKNSAVATSYRDSYYNSMPSILAIGRELPGPGVMYKTVSVTEEVIQADGRVESVPGKSTYEFEVFRPEMISIGELNSPLATGNPEVRTSNMAIKDRTAQIGSLKRVTQYGANGIKLSETINHYASDDVSSLDDYKQRLAAYNYQGVVEERFGDCRRVLRDDGNYDTKLVMSKREVYPSIQTGATTTDFRTGITSWNQTLAFDFYSSSPVRSVSADGYGNRFMTVTTPAYRKYPAMGLKLGAASNRNMLTQEAAVYTYKVDQSNTPTKLLAASAQTWSNDITVTGVDNSLPESTGKQPAVWRPWQSFMWMPLGTAEDGLTPLTGNGAFTDYFAGTNPTSWKKVSEATLYNVFSNALEAKDISGNFAATKMGFNHSKVLVSGGPAKYNEIAYTGAEEAQLPNKSFSGGVWPFWPTWAANPDDIATVYTESTRTGKTHTGHGSVRVRNNQNGIVYQPDLTNWDGSKPYRASVWATSPNVGLYYCVDENTSQAVTVTGRTDRSANGWYLLTLDIPIIGSGHSSLRVGVWNGTGQDAYFDDFRFQPTNAQTSAYVYDPLTGQVTDILDNNNLFTHYDYDALGHLRKVTRETFQSGAKTVIAHNYHYSGAPIDLDNARLAVVAQGSTATVNIEMPSSTIAPATVAYNTGIGTAYTSTTATSFSCSYPTKGTYWIKVRIGDAKGRTRELAYKLVL